ncbi:MAG: phosphate ABC transporter permease PstA [Cystobacterineae bacterium]|nr:phosphate ABC transporter permease PstA [Cystobacterineae bacterium]
MARGAYEMGTRVYRKRKCVDWVMRSWCIVATLFAVVPLFSVLAYVFVKGIGGLSWNFFVELPKPVGELGGGVGNAIVGSFVLLGIASVVGIPVGVLGGVYLSEFGSNRFGKAVRFCADVMAGVPSILIGIFVYTLVVLSMGSPSALAGGIALSILMLPTIIRTTEELIKLVPTSLREAGLALGMPKWRVILRVVLPAGMSGIATGVMLAIARAFGETAPLLFTAGYNRFWSASLDKRISSLPVQIYEYASSPYEEWHQQAWAAALILVLIVLILNVSAKLLTSSRSHAR